MDIRELTNRKNNIHIVFSESCAIQHISEKKRIVFDYGLILSTVLFQKIISLAL